MPTKCHVLIIEDEPPVAMLVRDIVEGQAATSFAIAETQDGAVAPAEGLSAVARSGAASLNAP